MEIFATPAAAAIIEKNQGGKRYILIQTRNKEGAGIENGMIELPAGKIREYENIFEALRREVFEETGLTVTSILGEESVLHQEENGFKTITFRPFCTTQNLSGGYSIIVQTFLCRAEGTLLETTNETTDIRWEEAEKVKELLLTSPQTFYPMHLGGLQKYFAEKI